MMFGKTRTAKEVVMPRKHVFMDAETRQLLGLFKEREGLRTLGDTVRKAVEIAWERLYKDSPGNPIKNRKDRWSLSEKKREA